jgi:hypothetical protein
LNFLALFDGHELTALLLRLVDVLVSGIFNSAFSPRLCAPWLLVRRIDSVSQHQRADVPVVAEGLRLFPQAFCVTGTDRFFSRSADAMRKTTCLKESVNGPEPDFSEDDIPTRRAWSAWSTGKERPGEDDASAG